MPLVHGRRVFLRSAGGLALGLPFLPSLLPRQAKGAPGDQAKRFIAKQRIGTRNHITRALSMGDQRHLQVFQHRHRKKGLRHLKATPHAQPANGARR